MSALRKERKESKGKKSLRKLKASIRLALCINCKGKGASGLLGKPCVMTSPLYDTTEQGQGFHIGTIFLSYFKYLRMQ
eukprot:scaffold51399_cov19-Tisochrysis_lutea.AAC.2